MRLKIISLTFLIAFLPTIAFGFVDVQIGPEEAKIESSIKYSVIGKYKAEFDRYSGTMRLDWENRDIESVELIIEAGTIRSNCGWCDKIVRSKQLLHVEDYPQIVFKSNDIIKDGNRYQVKGELDFHGVTKELTFPFDVIGEEVGRDGVTRINATGRWMINRKDFDVVWNRFLDKGGVLVGNTINVDWDIVIPVK